MCPENLKVGDFLTFIGDDNNIEIGRIFGFERHDKNSKREWAGKVHSAKMLVFPCWSDGQNHHDCIATVGRYYLEKAAYASELEIKAWMRAALEYEDALRDQANFVRKAWSRRIVKSRVVKMNDINKYEFQRLPPMPRCSWNWLWSMLHRMGIYNAKKGTINYDGL